MSFLDKVFSPGDDLPEFVVGETYFNDDYGGEIVVVNKQPFEVVYDYSDEEMPADRGLYRKKLKEGIIYPVDE